MTAFIGDVPSYDYDCDEWENFVEKFETYLKINDIETDAKKRAILILAIDDHTYEIVRNLCYPGSPKDRTYNDLFNMINDQFIVAASTSVFQQRYQFYRASQQDGETILKWFDRIRKLSTNCRFGDQFSSVIFDRFLSGICVPEIVDRLTQQFGELKLHQLIDLTLRFEQEMQQERTTKKLSDLTVAS